MFFFNLLMQNVLMFNCIQSCSIVFNRVQLYCKLAVVTTPNWESGHWESGHWESGRCALLFYKYLSTPPTSLTQNPHSTSEPSKNKPASLNFSSFSNRLHWIH